MRWLGRTALILLAIVALLAPALWIGRDIVPPRVARWAVNRAAGAEVVDDLAFRVEGLSTGHVALLDVRVNSDSALVAERVRVEFDTRELLRGRLRTVTVTGPILTATLRPDGSVGLGSLDPLVAAFADGSGDGSGEPPLRRLELRDARIDLGTGAEGTVRLAGSVAPSASGLAGSLSFRIDARTTADGPMPPGLALAAEGRATLERSPDVGVRVNAAITDGRAARGTLDVRGLNGVVVASLPPAAAPALSVELSATQAVAAGAALPAPSMNLRFDPAGISATARLGSAADPEAEIAAVADEPTADGRRRFRLDARAELSRLDALLAAWAGRPPIDVLGQARLTLAGSVPRDIVSAADLWAQAVASGGATLEVGRVGLAPLASGSAHGEMRAALALAAGRLAIETAAPAIMDIGLAEPLPGAAGELFGEGPQALTAGTDTLPLRVLIDTPFGDGRAEIDGPVRLTTVEGGRAELTGRILFRRGEGGWTFDRAERAVASASGFTASGVELDRLEAQLDDFTTVGGASRGVLSASARVSAPDHGVTGATVGASGRIESDGEGIRVVLTTPGRFAVDRLAPAAPLAPVEGLAGRIEASERPVLTIPATGPVVLRLPLDLPATAFASAEPGVWSVSLKPTRVVAEATLGTDGAGRLRARLSGASATVIPSGGAPAGVTLEGLAADLRMALAPGAARLDRLDIAARRVADQARLARFTPLSLEGFARGAETAASPDRLAFRMTLRGADGAFVLDAEGHHSPSAGRGEAELTLFPIQFVPGGLQPADLSPAAAALFRDASGKVSLGGRVRWPGEAVPPDDPLTLTLNSLGFTGSLGSVTGLEGAVALTHVDPPATAPSQTLTATAVDIGVPIVAPKVRFRLEPDRVLRLEQVEARFADGRVTAADVAVPLDADRPVPVVLSVHGVDAARLAEVIDLDGLAATGTLSGWLPLIWDPKTGLALRQARLTAAEGGGTLRYQPEDGAPALQDSGEQVSLLLRAIRNFVYESFEIEADGRPGEPFDVKLRLRGANPDLYDGYPIALNVTLTGALDQLFGNLRRSLGLTDVIRRRLEATSGG